MRITHISTGEMEGGACRAANRIHRGLLRAGVESKMYVRGRTTDDPSVVEFKPHRSIAQSIRHRLRGNAIKRDWKPYDNTRPSGLDMFSDSRSVIGSEYVSQIPDCDIVNTHWISLFADWDGFGVAPLSDKPLAISLHDMNAMTGGCHYANGCSGFTKSCGGCPQLGSTHDNDLSRANWRRKIDGLSKRRIDNTVVVANSTWLAEEARRSSILGRFPVKIIRYGLDTDDFAPRNKHESRDVLGIVPNAKVVLFVADSAVNPRKGYKFLLEALSKIKPDDSSLLLSIGGGKPETPKNWAHRHLGPIHGDRFLSLVYSAADVFVIPSIEDALPQTALESISCGTPVAGFSAGGIPDMVVNGRNGLLAPVGDSARLAAAIETILSDEVERARMSWECRNIALERFTMAANAKAYIELYESMLTGRRLKQEARLS